MEAKVTVKTFVRFLFPGALFPDEQDQEVGKDRDIVFIKPPAGAYCFKFYDRTFATTDEGELLTGEPRNWSVTFWIGGKVYADIDLPVTEDYDILRANVESNGWKRMIHLPTGNWQPFNDGDVVWNPRRFDIFDPELWEQSQ